MTDGWNGSGAFSVSVDMSANAAAGINIVASAFSNQMDVVKAGINACLTKNGENTPTGNLPMGGYSHTGTGKASAVDSYSRVNEFIHLSPLYMIDNDAGSTTISCTATPWPVSLSAGMHVYVKMAANKPDTTAANVTLRINGLSANCSANDGTQLWPGAFTSGQIHELIYDGANFRLMNPGYKVATATLQVKARTAGGAVTTASTTVSCSVEMWRDGNTATVIMARDSGGTRLQTSWQTSTGTAIYLSALPTWIRPASSTRYVQQTIYASGSTERFGSINTSTNGRIVIQNAGNNIGDLATVFPFQITYPVK